MFRGRDSRWIFICLSGIGVFSISGLWLAVGCLGGDTELPLGSMCTSADECEGSLVCVVGRCRSQCTYDRDCLEGQVCFANRTFPHELVCTFGEEGAGGIVDCPEGLARPEPGEACRQSCDITEDCGGDRLCIEQFCWDPGDWPAADAGDEDADVATGDAHEPDEAPDVFDADNDSGHDSMGDVEVDTDDHIEDGGSDADGDIVPVPHEGCAPDCVAWVIYPGDDMVECEYDNTQTETVDQCSAEQERCNVPAGWHLCTASQYLARGGRDVPGRWAWLRSCVKSGQQEPTPPTEGICASCSPVSDQNVDVSWKCDSSGISESYAWREIGVRSSGECRRVGVNDSEYEAYWGAAPATLGVEGAVCCSP